MGLDWWRGGGAVRSGVERHSFGVRTRLWGGGVRHQWLRSVSSNEIGKKFFTQQLQATRATVFYELWVLCLKINFKYGIIYEYGSEEEKVGMETEQRTEKRARCEIIPASAQVKHSHQKYDLKNHGKIYGRRK